MSSRHLPGETLRRLFQIVRVVLRQATRLAWRRIVGEPVRGPVLLREGFERVGGLFLKLGQILSLQIDTLPREYCDALLTLLDTVPTCGREAVAGVFIAEFGQPPDLLYLEFNYDALASASIGQVHKAKLRDGTLVAVKVRRPGVQRDFHRDILLMRSFVRMIFFFRIRSLYFMRDPVHELLTWTGDELDYRREAAHCDLLRANAADSPTERLPKVFWELTRSRILTMEFLAGPSVSAYFRMVENNDRQAMAELAAAGFDPRTFCGNVIANFLRDAFRFGVFHADLHPANLLILPDNVVGYVDFGIVAKLTPEARRKQIELTLACSSGDPEAIYRQFLATCMTPPGTDLKGMRNRVAEVSRSWYREPSIRGKSRFRVPITVVMMDLLTVCREYGVLVDREVIKYIRATILADGVISRLAPGMDIAGALREVVEDYLFEQARGKIFSSGGVISLLTDMVVWMKAGPASMLRALEQLDRGHSSPKTSPMQVRDPRRPLRARILAGVAVWAFTIAFLALGGGPAITSGSKFLAVMVGVFVTSWTIWQLVLLRRLALGK